MWHIFWRGYSRLRSGREHWAWMVVVEVRQGTLGGDTRGWGPAGNTGRGWSWLRSGREHWAGMVVVEVRQETLGVDGRGWGPAGNTEHGWSWLRSDREHCGSRVAVGRGGRGGRRGGRRGGGRRGGGGGRGRRQEEATDIKSNNPHLAGGELYSTILTSIYHLTSINHLTSCWLIQLFLRSCSSKHDSELLPAEIARATKTIQKQGRPKGKITHFPLFSSNHLSISDWSNPSNLV